MAKIVITVEQAEMLQKLNNSKVIKITAEQFKLIEAEISKDKTLLGHPIAGDGSDYEPQSEKDNEKTNKSFNEEALNENFSISEFYQQVIEFIKQLYTDPTQEGLSTFWVKMGLTNGEVLTALTGTGLIMGTMVGGHMVYAMAKNGKPAEMIKKIAKTIYKLIKNKEQEKRVPIKYQGANQPKNPMDPRYSKVEEDTFPAKTVKNREFRCLWNDNEMAIVVDSNNVKYIFSFHDKDKADFRDYADAQGDYEGRDEDGDPIIYYDDDSWELDTQVIEDYINDNEGNLSRGKGLEFYESGGDLSIINDELAQYVLDLNKGDKKVLELLTNNESATTTVRKPLKEGGIFRNYTLLNDFDFTQYKEAFKKQNPEQTVKKAKDGSFYVGFRGNDVVWKYIVEDGKIYSDMDDSEILSLIHPLQDVKETTTSASSGAFVAPLGAPIKRNLATEAEAPKITMFSDESGIESKHMDEVSEGDNVIKIILTLNELGLAKFNKIPTFKNLLHSNQIKNLKVGDNLLTVNHYIFSKLARVVEYDSENMDLKRANESIGETTTSASSGAYVTPKVWAKSKKDMRFGSKTIYPKGKIVQSESNNQSLTAYPDGKFVTFDDCTKLNNNKEAQNGGCSVGTIDKVVKTKGGKKSVVSKDALYYEIAKITGKDEKDVQSIVEQYLLNKTKRND